jgi:uncharacterized MAPEG superfamily protein
VTTELTLLAWVLLLALAQVLLAAAGRTRQYGTWWNTGPRDEAMPPVGKFTARLERAQANLFETLPLFIAAVLIAHVAGREGPRTRLGAELYFWGRVVYLPLYVLGVPVARSLVWVASLVGLLLIVLAVLRPA